MSDDDPHLPPAAAEPQAEGPRLHDIRPLGYVIIILSLLYAAHLTLTEGVVPEHERGASITPAGLVFYESLICYTIWIYLAARNVRILRGKDSISPVFAVLSHLIPIYYFVGPCITMRKLIRGSYPFDEEVQIDLIFALVWWCCVIGVVLTLAITSRAFFPGDPFPGMVLFLWDAAAVLLSILIHRIGSDQAGYRAALGGV